MRGRSAVNTSTYLIVPLNFFNIFFQTPNVCKFTIHFFFFSEKLKTKSNILKNKKNE